MQPVEKASRVGRRIGCFAIWEPVLEEQPRGPFGGPFNLYMCSAGVSPREGQP
jgi:hypothetical protein